MQARAHCETSDAYGGVIVLSGRWRVVRCRDDIQYIVQKRQAWSDIHPWRALAYVFDATALPAVLQRQRAAPEATRALLALWAARSRPEAGASRAARYEANV